MIKHKCIICSHEYKWFDQYNRVKIGNSYINYCIKCEDAMDEIVVGIHKDITKKKLIK